jgi:hypothetical protein
MRKETFIKVLSIFIILLFFFTCYQCSGNSPQPVIIEPGKEIPPITGTPLLWGVDDAGAYPNLIPVSEVSQRIIKEFGFDLFVHHYSPVVSYAANATKLQNLHDFYSDLGVKWILNMESANWNRSFVDEKGYDWYNRNDGRHYFQFPIEMLQLLSEMKNKPGLMYDEADHMQNGRNGTTIPGFDAPFFMSDETAGSLEDAAENFTKEVQKIVQQHEPYKLDIYTEHVFPIQYHTFARGGMIPVSKILKENVSPAYIATAIGAAIQYDKPFWLTPDLWHINSYPGHSVETYRSALLLAYHMGAEAIYTENLSYQGSLVYVNENGDNYRVTEYGKVAKWFRSDYAPKNPRNYTFKQLIPRVVIIRQEDACWGQSNSWLPDQLFGVNEWKSTPVTEAWLQIWHLLSRGKISYHSISWHNREVQKQPYQLLYPLDGVVVFDHQVRMPHIKDAELIFLTGLKVSEATLNDVKELVKQGVVCVTLPHLAPAEVIAKTGSNGVLTDGQGKWIVCESFLNLKGDPELDPFLPSGDYIRYQFGNTEVKFTPAGGDNNKIKVNITSLTN